MSSSLAALSPEARILLLCAGPASNDTALARLLAGPVRWGRLSALCDAERALPVVWARIAPLARDVPAEVRGRLTQVARVHEFRQAHLEAQLVPVLRLLESMQARGVLLKGAALATAVYPSFALRPMSDVDLLVAPDRAEEVHGALLRSGWRRRDLGTTDAEAAVRLDDFYRAHHHLWPLEATHGPAVRLEIHTDIAPDGHPFGFGAADVWREAEPIHYRGVPVHVPSAAHLLLHLCLHFAWSNALRTGAWRAFRDVCALTAQGRIDWRRFVELARASRGATCCYWTLRLARNLAAVEVPAEALAALRPALAEAALRRLEHHLAHDMLLTEAVCPSASIREWLWGAAIQPRRSGHGAARPWLHEGEFPDPVAAALKPRGVAKLRAQLRRGAQWRRFLRGLVVPSPHPT